MNPALKKSGWAPPIARSFTVPWTARDPMSPPRKNNGLTTKESVVNAILDPPICKMAWSSKRSSRGFENSGRNTSRSSSALSRPPLP